MKKAIMHDGKPLVADGRIVQVDVPSGGTDLTLGLTAAQPGQIARITAVDASGAPTAWEPVDMPTGGGGETWEKIAEIELLEAANIITVDKDIDGKPFALKRVKFNSTLLLNAENRPTYVNVKLNKSACMKNKSINSGWNIAYFSFYAELIPGNGTMTWGTAAGQNYNWASEIEQMGYKYNSLSEAIAITEISIIANDGQKVLGDAESKIVIFGVRV